MTIINFEKNKDTSNKELESEINQLVNSTNDERFLRSIFTMMREYISGQTDSILTAEQKAEIDLRLELHLAGKLKNHSLVEMMKKAKAKL
ncbi:MAG: hypothetical protein ABI723_10315 [Bacteroidia bacterium]